MHTTHENYKKKERRDDDDNNNWSRYIGVGSKKMTTVKRCFCQQGFAFS